MDNYKIKVKDEGLEPITKDPALISGAEAKLAWANGKDVQTATLPILHEQSCWMNLPGGFGLDVFDESPDRVFRLKPQTIKLELELPKPFEPKDGDECFIFDSEQEDGFYRFIYRENSGFHENLIQFGAYRSEAEVKQVVEQLRKIRGTNS